MGECFPQKLDGEFSIVLFDFKKKQLLMSTDIFATKPLHYCALDKGIFISSFRQTIDEVLAHTSIIKSLKVSLTASARNRPKRNRVIEKLAQVVPNPFPEVIRVPHNSIFSVSLRSLSPINKSKVHNFDLRQHKKYYEDWSEAFENAIRKRIGNNHDRKIFIATQFRTRFWRYRLLF